jgi:hypothetical protein
MNSEVYFIALNEYLMNPAGKKFQEACELSNTDTK